MYTCCFLCRHPEEARPLGGGRQLLNTHPGWSLTALATPSCWPPLACPGCCQPHCLGQPQHLTLHHLSQDAQARAGSSILPWQLTPAPFCGTLGNLQLWHKIMLETGHHTRIPRVWAEPVSEAGPFLLLGYHIHNARRGWGRGGQMLGIQQLCPSWSWGQQSAPLTSCNNWRRLNGPGSGWCSLLPRVLRDLPLTPRERTGCL